MKLKEWQIKNNISNSDLAQRLGVHVSYLTHLHKKRRTPSPQLASKIEKVTNGDVTRLEVLYP